MRSFTLSILASAAALAPVAASAADLPSRKAAPVEYVRVCSVHGEGFFYIPGTQTCLQIGGRVRAEYRYTEPKGAAPGLGRAVDATGFRAIGRLNIDARTSTEYGTLRTFIRYDIAADRGVYGAGTFATLDRGFIQFAGLTAGRVQSFFDFYANDWNYGGFSGSDAATNVLAYTATFGGGFSATLAIEDGTTREVNSANYLRAGTRVPDVVANLLYEAGWGSAQLSGAIHELRSRAIVGTALVDTEYGFAIQGGVKINLPMLAAGDVLWLQAAYADGATSYLGFGGDVAIGRVTALVSDAVIVGTELQTTEGFGLTAAFTHYWTPSFRTSILGNYTELDYGRSASAIGFFDSRYYTALGQAVWTPVTGFDIGLEVSYTNIDPKTNVFLFPGPGFKGSEDVLEARLRLQRDF